MGDLTTPRAAMPRWLWGGTLTYGVATLAAVMAPELLIAALWLFGVRPEPISDSYMWPGNWGWFVLLVYSFSLILGWAFILGLIVRNAVVTWSMGIREAAFGWGIALFSIGMYVAHYRGYVGWVHLIKT